MTDNRQFISSAIEPKPSKSVSLSDRTLAITVLLLAGVAFLLPTLLGAVIMGYGDNRAWSIPSLSPVFAAYSFTAGSETGFIREIWPTFPALVFGVFAAQPRTRDLALACLTAIMIVVAFGGSLVLHYMPADDILRDIAVEIGGEFTRERATALEFVRETISLTRTIAVTYLTAILAKVATEKAMR